MALCLVTGGAGFIGSHLVEALLGRGHAVRVLDNFSTGDPANLAEALDRIELLRGDLRDRALLREAVAGVDCVFHLAAPVEGGGLSDPLEAHHGGATGTLELLVCARDARVRRVVYASSCCVYGEPAGLARHEDELPQPRSPYAVAKLTGEQHCAAFTGAYGLETVRLRYFNVYGPRLPLKNPYSAKLVHILRAMLAGRRPLIHGGELELQDLIYVEDVAHASLLAATARRVSGKVYNVGGGRPVSTLQIVAALNAILGTAIQPIGIMPPPGGEMHHLACIERAEADLGFCPATDLEKGLRRCVEYYAGRLEEIAS
jgi:UDP-glucose 4-epimerase